MGSVNLELSFDEACFLAVRLEYIVREFDEFAAEERKRNPPRQHRIVMYGEHAAFFRRLALSIRSQVGAGPSVVV